MSSYVCCFVEVYMNRVRNKVFSREFLRSLFIVQNKWHQHGVLLHILRVCYYCIKGGDLKFIAAALLHDISKPFVAYVKDEEDIKYKEYSFTDHEERSYVMIKDLFFISEYTKNLVRYHYLIRDIEKSKKNDLES